MQTEKLLLPRWIIPLEGKTKLRPGNRERENCRTHPAFGPRER